MNSISFTIPLPPRSKKNSQQIVRLKTGRMLVVQSEKYKELERKSKAYMPKMESPIDCPVTLQCVYYMPTRRRVDLVNLLNATCDILVKHGVLADDNSNIVCSVDGSRVHYDRDNPRTEVTIIPVEK